MLVARAGGDPTLDDEDEPVTFGDLYTAMGYLQAHFLGGEAMHYTRALQLRQRDDVARSWERAADQLEKADA